MMLSGVERRAHAVAHTVSTVFFILVTQLKGNTNFIHKKGPRNEQERLGRIGLQVPLAMYTLSLSICTLCLPR